METRVKKYKPYRKQIVKENSIILKNTKNEKELSKIENKLSKIDKSLIEIEEIDLFSTPIVYEEKWQNYLKPLKEIISFYDLSEISKVLLLSQEPVKKIDLSGEDYKEFLLSLMENDPNSTEIDKIRNRINYKIENQEEYKRKIKDLNNHIDKMLLDCKKIREDDFFIKSINKYEESIKKSNFIKIAFIVSTVLFLLLLITSIFLFIFGGIK